jgi:glycosyltransferase involved in cell wall biosynthesis
VLRHTLLSLLDQSHKPDRIVVCLSKEPYLIDEGIKELPSWFEAMLGQHEVEVLWVENTGPYRKLMPIYRQATDEDWLVTCDDDVIYGPQWLASLVQTGREQPAAIVCGRARRPVKTPWKARQSYVNWPIAPAGSTGKDLLPIGIAGVLYRKPLLNKSVMFNDDFKELAPKQDDLWFNLAREVAGTNVVVSVDAGSYVYPIEAPGALSDTNVMTKSAGWDNFIKAIYGRVSIRFKGYLGMSVCGNDLIIKRLEDYRKKLGC